MRRDRIGVGTRFIAWIIDTILTLALYAAALGILYKMDLITIETLKYIPDSLSFIDIQYKQNIIIDTLIFLTVSLSYNATEIAFAATPGKYLLGIQIKGEYGNKASTTQLVMRYLLKWGGGILLFIGTLILSTYQINIVYFIGRAISAIINLGYLLAFGESKQALHDRLALTAVYKRSPNNPRSHIEQRLKKDIEENINKPERPDSVNKLIF